MNFNKRWLVVIIVVMVNLLMEYSLRGINNFLKTPALSVLLVLNYLPYYALLEHAMGAYQLKDYQLWILAQIFGLMWQLVSVAALFYPPLTLGVNAGVLFINNLIWWPTLQALLAFYIARRIIPGIDRQKPLLGRKGVAALFIMFILVSFSFHLFAPGLRYPQIHQILILAILISILAYVFKKSVKRNLAMPVKFVPGKFLDLLSIFTIVYLIISFFYFTQDQSILNTTILNKQALRVNVPVSISIATMLLVYRLKTKKTIPL